MKLFEKILLVACEGRGERFNSIGMGTACRTEMRAFLIGNTAENVLQQAGTSILIVKPAGFVTPVTV